MSNLSVCFRDLACEWIERAPMSEQTTFKIGGPADGLLIVHDAASLQTAQQRLREEGVRAMLIGCGSNLLVADEGLRSVVIRFDSGHAAIRQIDKTVLRVDAGVPLAKLSRFAQQQGLSGLEFACGIPGSTGGAVYMNAGAYGGEMVGVLCDAEVLFPSGERRTLAVEELELSYRHSNLMQTAGFVLSATVALTPGDPEVIHRTMSELLTARREKQPLEYPSAGSFFKRPEGHFAGKLIDDCGLRGYRVGDAQISEKHAGFVINRGAATCEQIKQLARDVRTRVFEQFGVSLEPEVRLLGTSWDE